jgi:hypothetical protein
MGDFERVRDALVATGITVKHFEARDVPPPYIIWAEDGGGEVLYADDGPGERTFSGTVSFFTAAEDDPGAGLIEAALEASAETWRMTGIGLEPETGLVFYEWQFSVFELKF